MPLFSPLHQPWKFSIYLQVSLLLFSPPFSSLVNLREGNSFSLSYVLLFTSEVDVSCLHWTFAVLLWIAYSVFAHFLLGCLSSPYWFIRNISILTVNLYAFCLYFNLGFGVFYYTEFKTSSVIIINLFRPSTCSVLFCAFPTSRLNTYAPIYFFQILLNKECLWLALWFTSSMFLLLVRTIAGIIIFHMLPPVQVSTVTFFPSHVKFHSFTICSCFLANMGLFLDSSLLCWSIFLPTSKPKPQFQLLLRL